MTNFAYVGLVVTGVATVTFYAWNSQPRATVDRAVAPLKVPERRLGHSANDLVTFREVAVGHSIESEKSALNLYRNSVLRIDIGFAVSLAFFSFFCWRVAAQHIQLPLLQSIAPICQMAAFIYGLSDVAEDLTLRRLLAPDRLIRINDANISSVFTLLKMISLCATLVGGLAFGILILAFKKR